MNNHSPRRDRVRALHDVKGATQKEIAAALGVSQATVQRDLAQTEPVITRTPDEVKKHLKAIKHGYPSGNEGRHHPGMKHPGYFSRGTV